MTLSDRTLTLVAMIAIGLSLLAILFVILGGSRGRGQPTALAGDDAVGALLGKIDRLEQAVRALNATDRTPQVQIEGSVRRVGVLRYDAFEDVGGRLSFSCALLDDHGTGVVLTSINGRQETRVYAKPLTAGQSTYNLSPRGRGSDPTGDAARRRGSGGSTMIWRREDAEAAPGSGPGRHRERKDGDMAENDGEVTIVGTRRAAGGQRRVGRQPADRRPGERPDQRRRRRHPVPAEPGRGRHPRAERQRGGPLQGQHRREGQGAPRRAAASTATSPRRPSSSRRAASSTGRASWTPAPRRVPRPHRPPRRRRARPPRRRRNPAR